MSRSKKKGKGGVRVTRVVYHKARAGKEERFLQMMIDVADAWKKQIPEVDVVRYASATAERGVFIVLVHLPAEHIHHFYEWTGAALEREWGKKETDTFLAEYYGCLEDSKQIAVVTEAR